MARQTVTITEGPAGSGKSLARCAAFLVDEFLPEETGVHLSNFPIFKPAKDQDGNVPDEAETYVLRIAEHVGKEWAKDPAIFVERLRQIPPETEATWRRDVSDGGSGPWDYLEHEDITGWHIAIDEGHSVCGVHHSTKHKKRWTEYLGELRHRGATIEFLSQDVGKLAKEVQREAGSMLTLVNAAQRRDPLFQISLEDWYEMYSGFITRKWASKCFEVERRKAAGRWVKERVKAFPLSAKYFRLYDSYDAPKHGGKEAANPPRREFERRGRLGLLLWFIMKNFEQLSWRVGAAAVLFWLGLGGGVEMVWAKYWTMLETKSKSIAKRNLTGERTPEGMGDRPGKYVKVTTPRATAGSQTRSLPEAGGSEKTLPAPVPLDLGPVWLGQIRGVTPEGVLMVDGFQVKVGEDLDERDGDEAAYAVVEAVEPVRGRFRVDGKWYRLQDAAPATFKPYTLRDAVRSGQTAVITTTGDAIRGQTSYISRAGNERRGNLSIPLRELESERRLGPVFRQPDGDDQSAGRDVDGSPAIDRPAAEY